MEALAVRQHLDAAECHHSRNCFPLPTSSLSDSTYNTTSTFSMASTSLATTTMSTTSTSCTYSSTVQYPSGLTLWLVLYPCLLLAARVLMIQTPCPHSPVTPIFLLQYHQQSHFKCPNLRACTLFNYQTFLPPVYRLSLITLFF